MARTHRRAVLAATLISLVVAAAAVPAQGSRLAARGSRPGRYGAAAIPASDGAPPVTAVLRSTANRIGMGDPDEAPVGVPLDPTTYLRLRAEQEAKYRGAPFDLPYNARESAIRVADRETAAIESAVAGGRARTAVPAWTPIGPTPIPNGLTFPTEHPVSGRATAIAIDPADANVVYVGTAQGGLYRTTDGGGHWTPMMDGAASLAIGALALSADGSRLYVGTGEGTMAMDSFAGVGLYRIDDPAGAFSLHGPFEQRVAGTGTTAGNGHAFRFDSIAGIAVDPGNAGRIYVAVTAGVIGDGAISFFGRDPAGEVGLYRSTNATTVSPTFSKVAGGLPADTGSSHFGGSDVMFLPGSSSTLLVSLWDIGQSTWTSNGVFRTTTADQATPTFTEVTMPNTVFGIRFAASGAGPSSVVVAAGLATDDFATFYGGRVYGSTDGGATFPTTFDSASGFCGGQCIFDVAAAVDPTDPDHMLVGGSVKSGGGASPMIRSTDGASFSYSGDDLHADTHAVEFAPSNPSVVYTADDGGIFRSADGGATWMSLNTPEFSATQFESIAVHPINPSFTIGGTQDNGTVLRGVGGGWQRVDYSDGGFAQIDQNATSTHDLTMYHTYFNRSGSLVGYVVATSASDAHDGGWIFRGCNGSASSNGIDCSESPQFYPPLALGPGDPNTVYFGTNVLHRSADEGVTNPVVSQQMGCGISAIGISPVNDNVRVVGDECGQAFGTTTGNTNLSYLGLPKPSNVTPYVSRVVFDPNDPNTVYVAEDSYLGGTGPGLSHVWKTSNMNANPPTWVELDGNGTLPDVPVNAFAIDPINTQHLYAGTDIGVFATMDGGASWAPFGTGLPRVAVFDMALASPGTDSEVLRIATHGRGMWDAPIGASAPDTTPPPAPDISAHPPTPTNQTHATFVFSDTEDVAAFWCSLDGAPPSPCSSPATYDPLAPGSHTFTMAADDEVLNESTPATVTWLVDTTAPPAPNIGTHPAAATNRTSASFGFSDAEGGVAFTCSLDGAPAAACTSPAKFAGLSQGTHSFEVRADDAAHNESDGSTFTWQVDVTPPTASMTKPSTAVTRALGMPVRWTGKDDANGAGVASYDVRVRQAPIDGNFGGYSPLLTATTATSITAPVGTGVTYCFSARARDAAGNPSPYAAERCSEVPLDDQGIGASGGWTSQHDQPGAFLGTLSVAKTRGATLAVGGVHVRQVALVVKRCAVCGSIEVLFGASKLGTIDTRGSGFAVLATPALSSLRTGPVTLRVASSGKPVKVDAVAFLRTAALNPSTGR